MFPEQYFPSLFFPASYFPKGPDLPALTDPFHIANVAGQLDALRDIHQRASGVARVTGRSASVGNVEGKADGPDPV